ncbi:hypothetical protein GBA52_020722 [Prunus armeniaca]|nr:hypothetical protein GBA52_020722 [Prunus armeniaca]
MVETRPRILVKYMLLSFLLWQLVFRHGSSDTITLLDPNEDSDTNNLKIKCTEDCVHDKNRYCHVKEFSFTGAALTGSIPEEVENLTYLETLDLSSNKLTGSIPETLWNLSSLIQLDLSSNQLTGGISGRIGHLRNLTILSIVFWPKSYLDHNFLSGQIPSSLGALRSLQTFWAASNDLTGEFPDYGSLNQLRFFSISGNYMSGRFPADFIRKWTQIYFLSIVGNNFEGNLPAEIFNFSSLQYLMISDVANSGFQFPRSANLSNINILDLSFNYLTGRIPESMSGLNLTHLSLAKNKLNDTIPAWVGGAVKTRLDPMKRMHMHCPGRKSKYRSSLFINCGGEGLTVGDNYYEADESTSLYYISPSKTWAYSLSGDFLFSQSNSSNFIQNQPGGIHVPEADLYSNARLAPVFLSYYVCLHEGKYNVTLHFAEIVFREKESYSILKRRAFDVYIQDERRLMNFDIAKEAKGPGEPQTRHFEADVNDSVLEISFYWAGKGCADDQLTLNGPLISAISITPVPQHSALRRKLKKALIITLTSSVVVLLLLLAFMWKMGWLGKRELREIQIGQDKHVTLQELKAATQKFSSKMEIGRGHFGRVYKAELEGGQTTVAVKRLSTHSKEKVEELLNEFYALKSFRHENLVQLLDAYFGEEMHLLIYEYMPNLSIADAFFGYKVNHESEYLLDMAYVAYKNGSLVDLVDKNLSGIYDAKQAITILTLAVKCTNISPTLRPRMADVVSILVGEKTFEQINPPTVDDHQLNVAMAHGECTKADSSTSTDVTSTASTSTKLIKGIDETQNSSAETNLEISEESRISH